MMIVKRVNGKLMIIEKQYWLVMGLLIGALVIGLTGYFSSFFAFADQQELYVLYVETPDNHPISLSGTEFSMNTIKTAIYSSTSQQAVVTIYVQDSDHVPLGVAIFKTTLLQGVTPIEYGFTMHGMATDIEKSVYINIFNDYSFTTPLAAEFEGRI